jgi:hypothetical protein
MKLRRALFLIVGVLLCILWVDFITPRFHTGPHDYLMVSPPIVVMGSRLDCDCRIYRHFDETVKKKINFQIRTPPRFACPWLQICPPRWGSQRIGRTRTSSI